MAYSDLDTDIVYTGDGASTVFPINFARTSNDQVVVEKWDITDPANPVKQSYLEVTDYSIVNDDVVAVSPPSATEQIFVYRSTSPVHETNYTEYEFPFPTVNVDLDTVYQLAQENKRALARSVSNAYYNDVSGNGVQVSADDLATNTANIATNAADIATNTGNIATNAADIATNAGNIATNTSNIATNTANIATNSSDIATLQGQIGAIVTPNVVSITSAQTYAASNADVVILDTGDAVQVDLPAPASGVFVRVKGTADVSSKTVVSAAGIDGFGTTYTLSSEYESVSLVSDGTKWYII